jgi:hypothetical protein
VAKLYLTHNFVQNRTCGDCVMCCKVLGIEDAEFSKPAGVLCGHCTGTGCGIYDVRPTTCRTFFCLWRRVEGLADHARPDLTGVIFTLEGQKNPANPFDWLHIVGRADGADQAAYAAPGVQEQLDLFKGEGTLPVFLNEGGQKRLVYPEAELVDAIWNPETTPHQHLRPRAEAWVQRYERFVAAFWEERDRAEAAGKAA